MLRDSPVDSPTALIAAVGDDLTPTELRIAAAVLNDPSLLAFGTVAQLAREVGTSRPSVVRFAVKLGFDGYTDLQATVRRGLSHQLFRPSDRIRQDEETKGAPARVALTDAVAAVFDSLDEATLATIGDPVAEAAAVWIVTGETSQAGANALLSGLSIVRPRVTLVESHTVGTALTDATPADVVVVFGFYRYRQHAVDTTRAFADAGVTVLAITDGPLSPLAQLSRTWIGINVPAVGPFDSSVPAVTAAELLVSHVARRLHTEATERIDLTETMWDTTHTFVPG